MESAVMDVSGLVYVLVLCVHAWYQRSLVYSRLFLEGFPTPFIMDFLLNDRHNILEHRSHISFDGNWFLSYHWVCHLSLLSLLFCYRPVLVYFLSGRMFH